MQLLLLYCSYLAISFVWSDGGYLSEMIGLSDDFDGDSGNAVDDLRSVRRFGKKLFKQLPFEESTKDSLQRKWKQLVEENRNKKVFEEWYKLVKMLTKKHDFKLEHELANLRTVVPKDLSKELYAGHLKTFFEMFGRKLGYKTNSVVLPPKTEEKIIVNNVEQTIYEDWQRRIKDAAVLVNEKIEESSPDVEMLIPTTMNKVEYTKFVKNIQSYMHGATGDASVDPATMKPFSLPDIPTFENPLESDVVLGEEEEAKLEEYIQRNFVKPHTKFGSNHWVLEHEDERVAMAKIEEENARRSKETPHKEVDQSDLLTDEEDDEDHREQLILLPPSNPYEDTIMTNGKSMMTGNEDWSLLPKEKHSKQDAFQKKMMDERKRWMKLQDMVKKRMDAIEKKVLRH